MTLIHSCFRGDLRYSHLVKKRPFSRKRDSTFPSPDSKYVLKHVLSHTRSDIWKHVGKQQPFVRAILALPSVCCTPLPYLPAPCLIGNALQEPQRLRAESYSEFGFLFHDGVRRQTSPTHRPLPCSCGCRARRVVYYIPITPFPSGRAELFYRLSFGCHLLRICRGVDVEGESEAPIDQV